MNDRFVLVVLADLGGQRDGRVGRLRRVDRDTIDGLPKRLGVRIDVPDGNRVTRLDVASLDDFHPDALARRLSVPAAAPPDAPSPPPPTPSGAPDLPPPPGGAGLLESILRTSEGAAPIDTGVGDFARRVSEPFTVRRSSAPDARSPALAAAVRAVLDDRRFRELEAAWRGLHGLVTAVESDGDAEIWVLDVGPADAPAALAEELAVEGAPPLAAIVAAFRYGPDDGALATLAGLAAVAQAVSAPVIADVDPRVLGLRDARDLGTSDAVARIGMIDHWRRFRRHPLASHVILCLPRVLARLPYGPHGEPVSFPFDEAVGGADHERFLWGSAALGLGAVLLRAFAAEGRDLRIERHAELGGLPVYVVRDPDGDRRAIPCAEVVMSAATIRAVVDQGCTVLASVRDEDRATFWGIGMLDGSPLPPLG